ncbi:MAG TPA: UDP-N-acetylmuramate:L-alanyl-gamma-D-glutamyl-meso-diaminopimelate ligase [Opitutaceae bacterium]|jgi:UDP-N-acetylmuramate: L-alanyl-gamma-D-glutamyl-meso-diaminopimelate ligase|nr:UDP-N-acetylmuramate:L-alanyl-gamma-D-glutamyl-meso-diaminopimelate ligase [Opitutaceae bacterium]
MRIYFMGVCGTAMGQAALLARSAGHEVSGSDTGVYPPMSTVLAEAGVEVHAGYDAQRLQRLRPDLVVIGNALSRGNPEVEWLLEDRALPFVSLPGFLHDRILSGRRSIVIAGTHGKTTTTALTAYLLRAQGRDPGFLIGGVPQDPPVGSHLGRRDDPFVIEGDEYDSAFFDKRSKFIHYAPRIAVLNNLEFDHADIFRDLADVQRAFGHFIRLVPRGGWIVLNGDDANLRALGPAPWTRVLRVGTGEDNDVRIAGFTETAAGAEFSLSFRGQPWGRVAWGLAGLYNARNAAMAAAAAGLALGSDDPRGLKLEALERFRGVRRRQEVLLAGPALTVIEDFGHHPTALAETLRSFRRRFPGTTLAAVFEPRSNTARLKKFQADFANALAEADEVYLGPVDRPEKLQPEERFDPEGVVNYLKSKGLSAAAAADHEALYAALAAATLPPDRGRPRLTIFFSNGSFGGIIGRYVAAARAA